MAPKTVMTVEIAVASEIAVPVEIADWSHSRARLLAGLIRGRDCGPGRELRRDRAPAKLRLWSRLRSRSRSIPQSQLASGSQKIATPARASEITMQLLARASDTIGPATTTKLHSLLAPAGTRRFDGQCHVWAADRLSCGGGPPGCPLGADARSSWCACLVVGPLGSV
jgi:hypothetical protein